MLAAVENPHGLEELSVGALYLFQAGGCLCWLTGLAVLCWPGLEELSTGALCLFQAGASPFISRARWLAGGGMLHPSAASHRHA